MCNADDDVHTVRTSQVKELQFLEKVKAKLRNRESYQDLLKTLNMYAQGIVTHEEMMGMVQDLFSRLPELMVRDLHPAYRIFSNPRARVRAVMITVLCSENLRRAALSVIYNTRNRVVYFFSGEYKSSTARFIPYTAEYQSEYAFT